MRRAPLLLLSIALLTPAAGAQKAPIGDLLSRAEELIDAGATDEAAGLLDRVLKREPRNPLGHLLRSTVYLVEGDVRAGRSALDRALELDPTLRRAWLNRGALDLSEQRLEPALEAFRRARDLAPGAADNAVNIGTVLLLMGRLPEATEEFKRYLGESARSADALYLVASNYAMAGYAALAVEHLRQAIERDERARLRARTDPNFGDLAGQDRFERLMGVDSYQPPPGAHLAEQIFDEPYRRGEGPLLQAVLDALQLTGQPFDRRVEVTPAWALVWGQMRIKVTDGGAGRGLIRLTAPAEVYTPDEWTRAAQSFFREVTVRVHALRGFGGQPSDRR